MRYLFLLILLVQLTGCASSYPPLPVNDQHLQKTNLIHIGDQLQIVILDEENLSGLYKVDTRGEIIMPLAGAIKIDGFTLLQASRAIGERLENGYLHHPQITLNFDRQRDVYILGEVQRPGNYPYLPGLTMLQAVAQAGGYTYRASHNTMVLCRQNNTMALQKYSASEESVLQPGDSITVQERLF